MFSPATSEARRSRAASGEECVDERLAHVKAAAARLQHPLDQLGDVGLRQDHRRELVTAGAGDEDAGRVVDPYLLDLRAVEWAPYECVRLILVRQG
jgi:hypothetical protein